MARLNTTQRTLGNGSGKLILFGEHAVVYGSPAIVAGLGTGATAAAHFASEARMTLTNGMTGERLTEVTPDEDKPLAKSYKAILAAFGVEGPMQVDVALHLPIGAGLGSSAAMAVACARAIQTIAGAEPGTVKHAVEASEKIFHGTPSGVDQAAALGGGLFRFKRPDEVQPLVVPPFRVLACQAAPGTSTAPMVARVRELHEQLPSLTDPIFTAIEAIVERAESALASADWERVGELMDINHGLLAALGVSAAPLDEAVHLARQSGAFGAKLTGAGGGGCVFAVAPPNAQEAVIEAWHQRGWPTFSFDLEPPRLR